MCERQLNVIILYKNNLLEYLDTPRAIIPDISHPVEASSEIVVSSSFPSALFLFMRIQLYILGMPLQGHCGHSIIGDENFPSKNKLHAPGRCNILAADSEAAALASNSAFIYS